MNKYVHNTHIYYTHTQKLIVTNTINHVIHVYYIFTLKFKKSNKNNPIYEGALSALIHLTTHTNKLRYIYKEKREKSLSRYSTKADSRSLT